MRRPSPSCIPSSLTTARTGPFCSMVTVSIRPVRATRRPRSGASSTLATSVSGPITWRSPDQAPAMATAPLRGMRQRVAPLTMSIASAASRSSTGLSGDWGRPGTTSSAPGWSVPAGSAWADHLSEPSGQVASVQCCEGKGLPSPRRLSGAPAFTAPRGQGTPNVWPRLSGGASSSIQRIGVCGGRGVAARAEDGSSAAALPSRLARSMSRRPMVNWLVMSPPSPVYSRMIEKLRSWIWLWVVRTPKWPWR